MTVKRRERRDTQRAAEKDYSQNSLFVQSVLDYMLSLAING